MLLAHGVALIFPRVWRILGGSPARLWGMEISGLALALLALTGLAVLMVRRIVVTRVRQVTTSMDWALEIALFAEVGMGFLVATHLPLGFPVVPLHRCAVGGVPAHPPA